MTPSEAGISLEVDLTLYPMAAVMRAAYKFTGPCHVTIRRMVENPDQRVMVTLTPKGSSHSVDECALAGDFQNELIDQRLRETLEAEFGPLREMIVAHAFSDTNLLDPARDDGDYLGDPQGIGLPAPQVNAQATPARHPAGVPTEPVALFRSRLSADGAGRPPSMDES